MKTLYATSLYLLITCLTCVNGIIFESESKPGQCLGQDGTSATLDPCIQGLLTKQDWTLGANGTIESATASGNKCLDVEVDGDHYGLTIPECSGKEMTFGIGHIKDTADPTREQRSIQIRLKKPLPSLGTDIVTVNRDINSDSKCIVTDNNGGVGVGPCFGGDNKAVSQAADWSMSSNIIITSSSQPTSTSTGTPQPTSTTSQPTITSASHPTST